MSQISPLAANTQYTLDGYDHIASMKALVPKVASPTHIKAENRFIIDLDGSKINLVLLQKASDLFGEIRVFRFIVTGQTSAHHRERWEKLANLDEQRLFIHMIPFVGVN